MNVWRPGVSKWMAEQQGKSISKLMMVSCFDCPPVYRGSWLLAACKKEVFTLQRYDHSQLFKSNLTIPYRYCYRASRLTRVTIYLESQSWTDMGSTSSNTIFIDWRCLSSLFGQVDQLFYRIHASEMQDLLPSGSRECKLRFKQSKLGLKKWNLRLVVQIWGRCPNYANSVQIVYANCC